MLKGKVRCAFLRAARSPGIFARDGRRMSGEAIIRSIALMHDRSNGLGGGFRRLRHLS